MSSLSKEILVWGKARGCMLQSLGSRRAELYGWFDVSPKNCTRLDPWAGTLLWWSCRSLVAQNHDLLNHPNTFHRGVFKLNAKSDADLLLYLLSHFECDSHMVHILTQWSLPPPLTSTVKSSLFTHAHSSPLFLAAKLHWCRSNYSHYIING